MLTRRQFITRTGAVGAGLLVPSSFGPRTVAAAAPLTRFADELPDLLSDVITPTGGRIRLEARQFLTRVHRDMPPTRWWGYVRPGTPSGTLRPGHLGPTVVVEQGSPVKVSYRDELPDEPLFPPAAFVPHDAPPVRIITHLHGGHVSGAADGNPFEMPLAGEYVPGETQRVWYANDQRGCLLFYHDHALHVTRQNVYAGLAGGWVVRDAGELAMIAAEALPFGAFELPLVIQDHAFHRRTGEQIYPDPWEPEWFGDTVLVNGRAWPYTHVEPRRYRVRLLNGSNSRFYHLAFSRGVTVHQIGTDGGLMESPKPIATVLLAPAERADLIVDFARASGRRVMLADLPLPADTVSPTRPLGDVMQFRVGSHVSDHAGDVLPDSLNGVEPDFHELDGIRTITLDEVMGRGGKPAMALMDGLGFHEDQQRMRPRVDSVEEWRIVNLTADTHPIHVHLVQFQVVGRQPFDAHGYMDELDEDREGDTPDVEPFLLAGSVRTPAPPAERGFKDTVRANPGEVTTIRMRFDLPRAIDPALGTYATDASGAPLYEQPEQRYVAHCHILEHEDNDMMRPFTVAA